MKESIGSTQLFIIVVVLVLLFTAIMTFTINRSNAFAMKDKIVTIIEDNQGVDSDTVDEISDTLQASNYRQKGKCSSGSGYQRNGDSCTGSNCAFCLEEIDATGNEMIDRGSMKYFRVTVFYSLDIPIINDSFNFQMVGETKIIEIK